MLHKIPSREGLGGFIPAIDGVVTNKVLQFKDFLWILFFLTKCFLPTPTPPKRGFRPFSHS
jgi:hypothetical protein